MAEIEVLDANGVKRTINTLPSAPATEAKQDAIIAAIGDIPEGGDATADLQTAGNATLASILAKQIAAPSTEAKQDAISTGIGGLTETAPVTDTASSGLNGRLQRIAQRISTLIGLLPTALGAGGGLKVDGSGTALPVSGTVTANAGTNLNTSALATSAQIGEVQATPTANTVLDRLKAIATALAGTLTVATHAVTQSGTWTLASRGYTAVASLTRTADTNAYAANDVLGAATGSTAALSFPNMGPSGSDIMITGASLEIDAASVISGETSYRLYLYSVTPPSALGDNAAFDLGSGDRASFLGFIDLGTPVDLGSTLYVEANQLGKQVKLSGTGLFGYLVTNGAYTPTSARVHVVTLHAAA